MLNFLLKTRQKSGCAPYARVGNGTARMYAFDCQRERLRLMLLTANHPVRSLTRPFTKNGMQPKGASRLQK
ncbi:hypothetical protein HMPREF0670_00943 [Prevotella sp. oral taxon 317 str. F0108]|nr:hypothetical protein HMPREF0670_00943 [Prevotella sp. oral taxon 317 str. F0108]